jgi:hypothetical protein
MEQYSDLISNHFKQKFIPADMEINTNIEISEAVALAVTQENKGLIALGSLLELTADTPAEKIINRIICKKIIGHQLLQSGQA